MDNKGKQIAKQGAILALASFVVRIIGILYRIPMTNILGDEGNGYYGYAFNIYMYLLILSSYAMPTAISKIISGQIALKKRAEAHLLFKASILLNILISAFFTVVLFFAAGPYAGFINVPGAEPAIKTLAPSLLIFGIMSSFRGYFQGLHTMVPTAVSQVIEQIFNAVFSILLSYLLMSQGANLGAAGGTMGTGIGALSALLFLVFIYFAYRSRLPRSITHDNPLKSEDIPKFWNIILMTSIPMVIGTATFNISTLIDDVMFSRALSFHNYSDQDISVLNGILSGKYTIIITMPIAIAAAIATASIPSVSASMALKDFDNLKEKIKRILKGTILIAMPASIGVFVMANPILRILFFNMGEFEKITTDILRIGAITILFFSVSTVSIGLLQGLGYVHIPVKSAIKSVLIKAAFNFVVFYAFNLNLYGAALANIVFSFVSAFFNLSAIAHKTKLKFDYTESLWRPLGASAAMGLIAFLMYFGLSSILPKNYFTNFLSSMVTIAVAMIVYFVLIIKLSIVSLEELKEMPMGARLSRLAMKFMR